MIKKRLLILAAHLERIAKNPPKKREFDLQDWIDPYACKTVCCAIGEGTFLPEFRKLGLRMRKNPIVPAYKKWDGWAAVEKFFGLGGGDAEHLFSRSEYPYDQRKSPAAVAARIRGFVTEASERAVDLTNKGD